MRVAGYVRVSVVGKRKGESFISPDEQRGRIAAYAEAKGWQVEWFEDLDKSGALWERPDFQRMLDEIRAGELRGAVVARISRLSRSVGDGWRAAKIISDAGGLVVSAEEGIELDAKSDPSASFVFTTMLSIAQLERDQKRAGLAYAREDAARRGVALAAHPPLGYVRGPDRHYTPDPETERHVREAFRMAAEGQPASAIGKMLTEAGARGAQGTIVWRANAVRKLLRNRTYLGEISAGEVVTAKAHLSLVDADTFRCANAKRQRVKPGVRPTVDVLCRGIARCAGCGYRMRISRQHAYPEGMTPNYRCHGVHPDGPCPAPCSIRADVLDRHVDHLVREHLTRRELEIEWVALDAELDAAEGVLDTSERELALFLERVGALDLDADSWREAASQRRDAVEAAREAVDDLRARKQALTPAGLPTDLLDLWDELPLTSRASTLPALIDAVVVRRVPAGGSRKSSPIADRARVLWRGEGPVDLPTRSRRGMRPLTEAWDDAELSAGLP